MANSARGVMKVALDNIDSVDTISARVADTAGLKYETLKQHAGVEHLAQLGDAHAVMLVRGTAGVSIQTIELP